MNNLSKHIVIIAILLFIAKISIADHLRTDNSKKGSKVQIFNKKRSGN
jgi:hypothetical protein